MWRRQLHAHVLSEAGSGAEAVRLDSNVGASSVATVGDYSVTFSVLNHRELEAEARHADSTLVTVKGGDVSGGIGGFSANA
jgi:hypothetical protein